VVTTGILLKEPDFDYKEIALKLRDEMDCYLIFISDLPAALVISSNQSP
jgi:hypothetical protein